MFQSIYMTMTEHRPHGPNLAVSICRLYEVNDNPGGEAMSGASELIAEDPCAAEVIAPPNNTRALSSLSRLITKSKRHFILSIAVQAH